MIATDSRQPTVMPASSVYVTSEPQGTDWGQPSVSHYILRVEGGRLLGEPIAGVYLTSRPFEPASITPWLAEEFEAWDTASDEALSNFEASLD